MREVAQFNVQTSHIGSRKGITFDTQAVLWIKHGTATYKMVYHPEYGWLLNHIDGWGNDGFIALLKHYHYGDALCHRLFETRRKREYRVLIHEYETCKGITISLTNVKR